MMPLRAGLHIALWLLATSSSAAGDIDVFLYAEPASTVKIFTYTSTASGAQPWVMNATIVESPGDPETVNGKTYRVRHQRSDGIDGYMPADTRVFYREEDDGVFTGYYDASGVFTEYLQIPVNIAVGESWQGPSGYWDKETLIKVDQFRAATAIYENCLFIDRARSLTGPPKQLMHSTSVHCPNIGHVETRTTHTMDKFQSVTEMVLHDVE